MAVDQCAKIRAMEHEHAVHLGFGGGHAVAADDGAFPVHHDQVIRRKLLAGHACGSHKQTVLDAHGDVAPGADEMPQLVAHGEARGDQLLTQFAAILKRFARRLHNTLLYAHCS